MKILGIDPGTTRLGWGIVAVNGQKLSALGFGIIGLKQGQVGDRLETIYRELSKLVKTNRPDRVAIERLFFARNQKTAMSVAQAAGVAMLVLAQHNLGFTELTPLQIKQSVTGYGAAPKQQVQKMVAMLLGLKEPPKPDDAADALAVAISASTRI